MAPPRKLVRDDADDDWPTSADGYVLQEEIGKGATATVWRAAVAADGRPAAVKVCALDAAPLDLLLREAATMRALRHPNLLRLHAAFVDGDALWLVLPLVTGGSVAAALAAAAARRGGRGGGGVAGDEALLATIARAALRGLEYLHAAGAVHRDLKAANLLLARGGTVLVADFGVSATLERAAVGCAADALVAADAAASPRGLCPPDGTPPPSTSAADSGSGRSGMAYLCRSTCVGTISHMPPEVVSEEGHDAAADIWSLGITLLELATGRAPWANMSMVQMALAVAHGEPPTLAAHCAEGGAPLPSAAACEFVAACLERTPGKRPTAASLLTHRFLRLARDDAYVASKLMPPGISAPLADWAGGDGDGAGGTPAGKKEVHRLVWKLPKCEDGVERTLTLTMTPWFGRAALFVGSVRFHQKKYSLLQQLRFTHDELTAVLPDDAGIGSLAGSRVTVSVGVGLDFRLHGDATLDGAPLPRPRYDFARPGAARDARPNRGAAAPGSAPGSSPPDDSGPSSGPSTGGGRAAPRASLAAAGLVPRPASDPKSTTRGSGSLPPLAEDSSLKGENGGAGNGSAPVGTMDAAPPSLARPGSSSALAPGPPTAPRAVPGGGGDGKREIALRRQVSEAFSTSGWSDGGLGTASDEPPVFDIASPPPGGPTTVAPSPGGDGDGVWQAHIDSLLTSFAAREAAWGDQRARLEADAAAARAAADDAADKAARAEAEVEALRRQVALLERALGDSAVMASMGER